MIEPTTVNIKELSEVKYGVPQGSVLRPILLPLYMLPNFSIECYGQADYMVNDLLLQCNGKVQQACYTRDNNEKGCIHLAKCSDPGWTCCYTDRCNA
uniref:Reverse transcriptase domain-containing protein n=1 Tax=Salarias fasciatus TaxID=181472 RepID=A0A672GI39_SALFA